MHLEHKPNGKTDMKKQGRPQALEKSGDLLCRNVGHELFPKLFGPPNYGLLKDLVDSRGNSHKSFSRLRNIITRSMDHIQTAILHGLGRSFRELN
jgi:hypothetical protein